MNKKIGIFFKFNKIFKKKIFSPLIWLLGVSFFKGLIWAGIVPLWHFPDEQAHFAQLQNTAEQRSISWKLKKTTSREIYESELILGTLRDERGNNKFTFHPEYNLSYTNIFIGEAEPKLKTLDVSTRQEMIINEATGYPPLYYVAGAIFYWLAYFGNLFNRVFLVRVFSVLITTVTIYLSYKIGELIFKKELLALVLGILVSFHPMFSFVGSGVSSDVLFNFFFTLFIWSSLLIFQKANIQSFSIFILSLVGGLLTKQQMIVGVLLLPLILGVFIWKKIRKIKKEIFSIKTALIVGISFLLILLALKYGELRRVFGFIRAGKDDNLRNLGLIEHLFWTGGHTIAEVLPWYWGVFKWLGVVLPRWVNRVQMRLLGLATIGLLVWLVKIFKRRKVKKIDWQIGFLVLVSGAYFMAVTLWDWQFRRAYGFSFGIQGRYFFPTIGAHMGLILFGLMNLVPQKLKPWLLLFLVNWWFVLFFIGLWTIITAYYQIWPLSTLGCQISQYKPFWFKGYWWFLWVSLFIFSFLGLLFNLFKKIIYEIQKN